MKHKLSLLGIFAAVMFFTAFTPVRQAQASGLAACAGGCCNCSTVRNYIIDEIKKHEDFLTDSFWADYFEPALSAMTNQINAGLTQQGQQMGAFLEGQDNIEKRRMLQELSAQTARNYLPSEELCRFGSLSQSLASSEDKARATRLALISRSQDRQLGIANTVSGGGDTADMMDRARDHLGRTCDPSANGGKDAATCQNGGKSGSTNGDIDFTKTFDSKPTLDIDFTSNAAATADEKDAIALSNNLFSSDLFQRPDTRDLKPTTNLNDSRMAYMDMRSIIAKRSVAENSFNTLLSLKAKGSGMDGDKVSGSTSFIAGILKEIGLKDNEAIAYLGKAPSYDAQMEVLTKKAYQSPSFYVNLMDNPANIERQYAAMQSFGLMQQRDIYDSILRSEMLLSQIVELEVAKYQDQVQGNMDKLAP